MGACDFAVTIFGKDAEEAFRSATQQARYEHGHGGYTGTIAEKTSFHFVDLKRLGMTLDQYFKAMNAAQALTYAEYDAKPNGSKRTKREQSKRDTAVRRARTKFDRLAKDKGYSIRQAFAISNDKWGPAICVEVTGKRAKEHRERYGLKGRKGGVFHFFGMASC